ncbi:MAG: class III poly(R)-hydroxyalkanoic acid synthase subunit PhaC [Proteobacteria bacterium]|nr:class III poly(R)-hydroxyalkanoic acid synthase subunit PhaC [Pseudomonadota bacterium]
MPRVRISPQQLGNEIAELQRQLGCATKNLAQAKDATLGSCQRDAVCRIGSATLYHYKALTNVGSSVPVLIVYALVNRPDMVDLQHDRSLVRALLERGLDLYLIDWGYPNGADRATTLSDYICRYIDSCVDYIRTTSEQERINLLGICQGGTFSACYSALNPKKIRNLITTVTPIDFHTPKDMLSHLFRHVDVDLMVDSSGNISGDLLNAMFLSLKPFRLAQQKYVHMLDDVDDEESMKMFLRMEKWIFDSPALAGAAFREFAGDFYQKNNLIKGQVRLGGHGVHLNNIDMPVLNIYARDDHLVPRDASLALAKYVGTSDYEAIEFPGGHIGIYVSSRAHIVLPDAIQAWLSRR